MATPAEIRALLATPCPWCGAWVGSECRVSGVRNPRIGRKGPSTLDGRCHDARWQAALGRPALVVRVPERRVDAEDEPRRGTVAVLDPPNERERPW